MGGWVGGWEEGTYHAAGKDVTQDVVFVGHGGPKNEGTNEGDKAVVGVFGDGHEFGQSHSLCAEIERDFVTTVGNVQRSAFLVLIYMGGWVGGWE